MKNIQEAGNYTEATQIVANKLEYVEVSHSNPVWLVIDRWTSVQFGCVCRTQQRYFLDKRQDEQENMDTDKNYTQSNGHSTLYITGDLSTFIKFN